MDLTRQNLLVLAKIMDIVPLTMGGNQHFNVVIDTGSSDLWVPKTGYKCFGLDGQPADPSSCGFTSTYDPKKSRTYKPYPNHNFNISYGGGEYLNGLVGFDTVTIGGLSVPAQEFGLVQNAAWDSQPETSGLLGLASPKLTNVFKGTNLTADVAANPEIYNPWFWSAVEKGLIQHPYFSIALNRGTFKQNLNSTFVPNLGVVAFGGVASASTTRTRVTVPILDIPVPVQGRTGYTFYVVKIDEYRFPGSSNTSISNTTAIIDSGTTLNLLPFAVAQAYAKAFDPPATFNSEVGGFLTLCKTKVPKFEVVIGGVPFAINGADQLLPTGSQNAQGQELCFLGTQNGGSNTATSLYLLGDVFMHNVVATFNILAKEVTLAQRAPY